MYCQKCGYFLAENARLCPQFGNQIVKASPEHSDEVADEPMQSPPAEAPVAPEVTADPVAPIATAPSFAGSATQIMYPPIYMPPVKPKMSAGKKVGIIFGIVGAVMVLAVCGVLLLPKLLISTEELLAQGNYEKAYAYAKEEEKADIVTENLIAVVCKEVVDGLKDPSSFELRKAWYDEEKQHLILKVSGKNSYGGVVSNYWYYTYDEEDKQYSLYVTLSDLEDEKTYSWDDTDERMEKVLKNLARKVVKEMIADDTLAIKKESVTRINDLFANDLLENVELLSVANIGAGSKDSYTS